MLFRSARRQGHPPGRGHRVRPRLHRPGCRALKVQDPNGEVGTLHALVLGDPLNSVAFMANKLAGYGRELKAGMVLMTGSIVASIPLEVGDHIEAKFTRLGSVSVQIEP